MYSIRIVLHVPNVSGTANTKSTYGWLDASLKFSKDKPKPISPKTFKDRSLRLEAHKYCWWMTKHGQVLQSERYPHHGYHSHSEFSHIIETVPTPKWESFSPSPPH